MMLQEMLPHYGLVDSSSCFFKAYQPVLTDRVNICSAPFYPCFLFHKDTSRVSDVLGLATVNCANSENEAYLEFKTHATRTFVTNKTNELLYAIFGYTLREINGSIMISQDEHIKLHTLLPISAVNPDLLRAVRGYLLFISQNFISDIAYEVAKTCQIEAKDTTKMDIYALYDTVQYLKETDDFKIKYFPLDQDALVIYVFSDGVHNTNQTSQQGILFF